MRILWLDPLNRDPQFVNLLALILRADGHQVVVRSNAREVFAPPATIDWRPFSSMRRFPRTLRGRPWARAQVAATYGYDWWRAARWAHRQGARAVLVTSGLAMARTDAWGLGRLRRHGVRPVVLVHKPYWGCYEDNQGVRAGAAAGYYRRAHRILTMTDYARALLGDLYDLPPQRFRTFPHPHFQPLLAQHPVDAGLLADLRAWAGTAPVATYAANVTAEHGFDDLPQVLVQLAARVPEVRLLVLAHLPDPVRQRAFEDQLQSAGLGGRYRCLWMPYSYGELQACLQVTGVILTPYRWATQSGVVSMAGGLGVPVASTDVGGLGEMVRPGVNGELAPAGDADALAAAAAKVLADAAGYRARTLAAAPFEPQPAARAVVAALSEASC